MPYRSICVVFADLYSTFLGRSFCLEGDKQLKESSDKLQYHVLKLIAESNMPQGAGAVSDALKGTDYSLSEAAMGRLLRSIRNDGYLKKVGFQGHVLTEIGKERLHNLEIRIKVRESLLACLDDADVRGGSFLCEALLSLRSLAHEMVCEGIKWAGGDDISSLETIVSKHIGEGCAECYQGVFSDFYRQLLKMSRIPMFDHFFNILEASVMGHLYMASIFREAEKTIGDTFAAIVDAIRERKPDVATEMINVQIDTIIAYVKNNLSCDG